MKNMLWLAVAALLSLSVVACRVPTDPSFSPDGKSLAYEKGGKLFLRSPQGLKKLTSEIEGPLAWSPDGRRLAYTTPVGTTVYETSTGKSIIVEHVSFPYWWKENELLGAVHDERETRATLVSINPFSGSVDPVANLDFAPVEIFPLSENRALIRDGSCHWYDFDGATCDQIGVLGEDVWIAGYLAPGQPRLFRYEIPAKAINWRIRLLSWDGNPAHSPRPTEVLDFSGLVPESIYAVQYFVRGDVQVVVVSGVRPASSKDAAKLVELIQDNDLWHAREDVDRAVLDEVEPLIERSQNAVTVLAKAGAGWETVFREITPLAQDVDVGLSPDGRQIAIVTAQGLRICPTH